MLTNLLNRFRKIRPKKDVHKYKKTYNLKANTEASKLRMFEYFTSKYSKVNFNIRPSPNSTMAGVQDYCHASLLGLSNTAILVSRSILKPLFTILNSSQYLKISQS